MKNSSKNDFNAAFGNTMLADAVFKPILFSTEMVKAILEGRKTQTRRIIKPQPDFDRAWKNLGMTEKFGLETELEIPELNLTGYFLGVSSPIGDGLKATGICIPNVPIKIHKGDILWVRETSVFLNNRFIYKADNESSMMLFSGWKPSIFMPKAACRIFLEVTDVRVERLQDISEGDAIAEGIEYIDIEEPFTVGYKLYGKHRIPDLMGRKAVTGTSIESYQTLWESINGSENWAENPFVWVYTFKRVERPHGFC